MDDYDGTQDVQSYGGNNYEVNTSDYDGGYKSYTGYLDDTPTQENQNSGFSNPNSPNDHSTPTNNESGLAETLKHSVSIESQELIPQSETLNCSEEGNSLQCDEIDQKDSSYPIVNQQPNDEERKFISENEEPPNDCCSCSGEPLMCLAICFDCFCF